MFTKQLNDLANSLMLVKFDLMGLSLLAFTSAHCVAAHPDRVRTWTLLDPNSATNKVSWRNVAVVGMWFEQTVHEPNAANGRPADFLQSQRIPG